MQRRNEGRAAGANFQSLWQTVETVNTGRADNQIRGQLLNLLAATHQSRETRRRHGRNERAALHQGEAVRQFVHPHGQGLP
jgi:hypothetical protein